MTRKDGTESENEETQTQMVGRIGTYRRGENFKTIHERNVRSLDEWASSYALNSRKFECEYAIPHPSVNK